MAPKAAAKARKPADDKLQQQAVEVSGELKASKPVPVSRGVTGLSSLAEEATAMLAAKTREQSRTRSAGDPSTTASDPAKADAAAPQAAVPPTATAAAQPTEPLDLVRRMLERCQ